MIQTSELHVARLSPDALSRVQALEKQLGNVYLIAYDQPAAPARLSDEQLQAIQELERDLGRCLIAYQKLTP
jgi:hypothetical protein